MPQDSKGGQAPCLLDELASLRCAVTRSVIWTAVQAKGLALFVNKEMSLRLMASPPFGALAIPQVNL